MYYSPILFILKMTFSYKMYLFFQIVACLQGIFQYTVPHSWWVFGVFLLPFKFMRQSSKGARMIVWWSLDQSLICSWSYLGGPATPDKIQHCFLFVDNGWSPKALEMALLPFPVWQMSATLFPSSFFRGMMCYFLKTFNPLHFVA